MPVIYTRGQGFDGQFEDGEVGYSVNCFDAEEIADRIEDVINNYDRFRIMLLTESRSLIGMFIRNI